MKPFVNIINLMIFCLIPLIAGCTQQTHSLQNQYGPRAAATQAKSWDLSDEYWFSTRSLYPTFAQATNNNIGVQIVRQEEITKPTPVGKVNPMAAVGAVDRYQKGQVRALTEMEVTVGGGNSRSGR